MGWGVNETANVVGVPWQSERPSNGGNSAVGYPSYEFRGSDFRSPQPQIRKLTQKTYTPVKGKFHPYDGTVLHRLSPLDSLTLVGIVT